MSLKEQVNCVPHDYYLKERGTRRTFLYRCKKCGAEFETVELFKQNPGYYWVKLLPETCPRGKGNWEIARYDPREIKTWEVFGGVRFSAEKQRIRIGPIVELPKDIGVFDAD